VSHEIGHTAFEETKDVTKSLHDMDGTMCRGGYFHGVLASYFHEVEESGKSFPDSYQTICNDLIGSSNYQDCVHGLGHGLVHYFGDDVNSAVDKCNDLSFYQDILCTKGVMMQYTDQILTRKGISQESISNLCIESELDKLDHQECSMSLGTTIAFFTNHNFDEGKVSCELIEDENTHKLCLDGLRLEIEDSEKYETTPLTLEKREKYQPQFVDDKTIDIRTPAIISNFSYSKDTETILFLIDRSGYVIMYVPFDLLPDGEAILTVNGQVPSNLASNDTAIKDHVAITFEVDSAGIVYLGPK
ncbi:MAG: thrombospondin, partial [Candidatus Nitrosomaritimum yanchengensis]